MQTNQWQTDQWLEMYTVTCACILHGSGDGAAGNSLVTLENLFKFLLRQGRRRWLRPKQNNIITKPLLRISANATNIKTLVNDREHASYY